MAEGELRLRDAEPYAITSPTTVTGTNTDGQLTGVAFSTPTIEIVQDVPQFNTQAFIDAVFSMVAPGVGTINEVADPEVPGAPALSGPVTFYDRTSVLGTVNLDQDGKANLVTGTLPAGTRDLCAVYTGAPPDWKPSTSTTVSYRAAAPQLVSTTLAGELQIGDADGKDFDVTVANTGFGSAFDNARLEVTVQRTDGSGPLATLELSRVLDGTPEPVILAGTSAVRTGVVGHAITWLLDPGQEHTES